MKAVGADGPQEPGNDETLQGTRGKCACRDLVQTTAGRKMQTTEQVAILEAEGADAGDGLGDRQKLQAAGSKCAFVDLFESGF
jgi:hypothetical protein